MERNGDMQPYAQLSGCGSDLITALITDPILSASFIGKLKGSNGTAAMNGDSTCVVSTIHNDTNFIFTVDTIMGVITQATLLTTGDTLRTLYNASFTWGMADDSIPYLEDMKIYGYSEFQRGGVDFFNCNVNGISGVRQSASIPRRSAAPYDVSIRQSGRTVRFDLPFGSSGASLYDMAGRMIRTVSFASVAARPSFSWDGKAAAAGRYAVAWYCSGHRFARLFSFGER